MGNKLEIKLIAFIAILLYVCTGLYAIDESKLAICKPLVKEAFLHLDGFHLLHHIKLSQEAEEMLNVDDYFYADFAGVTGRVNLYIGYYDSIDKASASHSPTICYPSQGWKIDKGPIDGMLKAGNRTINYQMITTSSGLHKEFVLYWYQAHLETNTKIYWNKIDIAINKLLYNYGHHFFIRVSVPIKNGNYFESEKIAKDFVVPFFQNFHNYLMRS